ncbi:MAG: ABC transporter permease, partial [Halodesulfurarchaeum sp.]
MRGARPVARRLLLGLKGDRRTLALVVVVPVFITFLFGEVFENPEFAAPALLGVFVFLLTYVLTAVGFLRERTAGTLERLLVSPISRNGLVVGYVIGFGYLATIQSLVLLASGVLFLEVTFDNGLWLFFLVELLGAFTALGIGIVFSLFAQNEFQVMQFMPAVISPQVIIGGAFVPVEDLPDYLEFVAYLMPITYLIDGMEYVIFDSGTADDFWVAIVALTIFTVLSIGLSALVVRR